MKFSVTLALAVFVGLVASSSAFPAQKRVVYYQRPAQYNAAPQRMMYVQYMHPSTNARSTQAAEALVAGESVATGTYLEDCDHAEGEISAAGPALEYGAPASVDALAAERGEDVLSEAGVHAAQAEAEAYPAAGESLPAFEVPADVDIVAEENEVPNDDAKEPRDFNLDTADSSAAGEADAASETVAAEESPETPAVNVEAAAENPAAGSPIEAPLDAGVASNLPAPAHIAPVSKPVNRYLPAKKKVYVELDQSVEDTGLVAISEEEASEDEEEETHVAPVSRRPARRPVVKKPAKAARPSNKQPTPLPAGTFFPIDFGGTSGGAIAIANSFSTGEGGSATSHAIAYGSPDAASARGCVSCKKH